MDREKKGSKKTFLQDVKNDGLLLKNISDSFFEDRRKNSAIPLKKEEKNSLNQSEKTVLKGNAIFPGKDIFILDPNAVNEFVGKGNTVFVPINIVSWLRVSMSRLDIGRDATDAINNIEILQKRGDNVLRVVGDRRKSKNQDKDLTREVIEIAAEMAKNLKKEFEKIKFVSRDPGARVMANYYANGEKKLVVGDYVKDNVLGGNEFKIPEVTITSEKLSRKKDFFLSEHLDKGVDISQNSGVVCCSDYTPNNT